jgi:hypothetical protein
VRRHGLQPSRDLLEQLHQAGNEVTWWKNLQIDALEIAKDLWKKTHTKDGHADPQSQSTTIHTSETTAKN